LNLAPGGFPDSHYTSNADPIYYRKKTQKNGLMVTLIHVTSKGKVQQSATCCNFITFQEKNKTAKSTNNSGEAFSAKRFQGVRF